MHVINMVISSGTTGGSRGLPHLGRFGALLFVLLLALCAGNATRAVAQLRYPVSVSFGSHSLTVPWHPGPVTNRFNPVFVVGTDRTLKTGEHTRLYAAANLGFFQHYWWVTGLYITTEMGVGYALPVGFHTDLRLGVGYLHYFWRRQILMLEDGRYVEATNWGKPSLMIPLSIMLGYRGNHDHPLRFAPFVSAQWAAQALFTDEIPVMTHFFLAVGVRIDLGRPTSTTGR